MKREGIDVLISLLTAEEQKELGLDRESSACEQADVQYLNFPIPDRQVPASRKAGRRIRRTDGRWGRGW
jgi:hypothetical protein